MKISTKLLIVFLSLFIVSELFPQSAVCSYNFRKRISFDPTKVMGASDLTDYTALISITSDNNLRTTANGGNVQNANGFDIVFTAADGVTLLSHQLEKYTATTGELVVWVKIPTLSTTYSTHIYMYYGNAAIVANQSSTNTWNSNYKGVYNLHTDYADKTSTGNNGTNNGLTLSTGTVANGSTVDNINDYVSIGTTGWSASNATYEMWVNSTSAWPATEAYFLGHTTLAAYNNRIQIYAFNGRLRVGLGNSHAIGGDLSGALATNRFYHVAVTYASGSHTVYLNGASVYTGVYTGLGAIGQADIGNNGNDHVQAMTGGKIDQMMISNTTRNANWIATVYNNQSSPSTFYSISSQPKVWTGGTNTNYVTATNWLGGNLPVSGDDVIINNGTNQPTFTSNQQVASIWLKTGATLSLATFSLSVRFDVTNCGTISGNTGVLNCNGTSAFIQTQYLSGSGTFNLNNLTINNTFAPSPAVELRKDVNVSGNLSLVSGILYTTSTYILALSNTASSSSGLATSFVSGPMSKNGATNFVFPVGKGNKWRRLALSNITASSTYTTEYFNSAYASTTPVNTPLTNVSLVEYWQCDRTGAGNANMTLYWEDASLSGITSCADLTIARWNGASWDERIGTASGSCSGTGVGNVVTNAVVTAFSPFTFGSKTTGSVNPLPISLVTFTAIPKGKVVDIEWRTVTELNNDHFAIERTIDGVSYETIAKVKGKGMSQVSQNYSTQDVSPFKGLSYYRLKQTDLNGEFSYSPLVPVNFSEESKESWSIYPNPNTGTFSFLKLEEGTVDISVYNALGEIVINERHEVINNMPYAGCKDLIPGVYLVRVLFNETSKYQKMIISK